MVILCVSTHGGNIIVKIISWKTQEDVTTQDIASILKQISQYGSEEMSWAQIQKLSLLIESINMFDFLLDFDTQSNAKANGLTEDETKEAFRIFVGLINGGSRDGVETNYGYVADLYDSNGFDVLQINDYWIIS